ncbi:MFS transporter [Maritimibacter sp. UBA3975]|uniref:MFS transporter n=1 Tax=Maritimibacter sp. UBA3975 TaxID=1946833 RepID=UPI000C09662F|nr:MFS transporter [Maritimibacter sp. UBA3975]MAM63669.1 MFS transporter [Maritimibacter sp.]|tara:strand:- start:11603 stop:12976 length:1374 start_codon:yes stop_codon:yes gene_type:complete
MATGDRKRIWGWYWFDWASQPYHTVLLTFIYGPFFATVATAFFIAGGMSETLADARAQTIWSMGLTITGLIIGFGGPILGALADTSGRRRPWIYAFTLLYVVGAWSLWYTDPAGSNIWAMLVAFGIGFIGAEFALVFVNAQLPGLVEDEAVGKTSGSGFAFGYLGGITALIVMLAVFAENDSGKTLIGLEPAFGLLDAEMREGTRIVGPFVALWFLVFMIPYYMWVREDHIPRKKHSISTAMQRLGGSIRALKDRRSLLNFLLSSMFYRDALNGLYGFGGVYATLVLDWQVTSIGIFGIISALAAAVFSWLGGRLDSRLGPKPVIIGAIIALIFVIITIVFMDREMLFGIPLEPGSRIPDIVMFGAGVVIGGMGGTLQAASRSLMVRHTDPAAPTESFGLYGLSGRATAFIAPALIGIFTAITGSARLGVSPLILLFLLGLVLLIWVRPDGEEYATR